MTANEKKIKRAPKARADSAMATFAAEKLAALPLVNYENLWFAVTACNHRFFSHFYSTRYHT